MTDWDKVKITVKVGAGVPDGPIRNEDGRAWGVGVIGYAHPVGEAWCSRCGQLVLFNLAVGFIAHDDPGDDERCEDPYPGERRERGE